jgi:hypothetical protein
MLCDSVAAAFHRLNPAGTGPPSPQRGNMMKKLIALASATALGLALAACDSPAEEAAEENAEVIEEQADTLEDTGAITDAQADTMEAQADNLEDSAEGDTDATTGDVEEAVN